MDKRCNYGDRIRQLRNAAGYSQSALAKLVGVSKSSINMYERGEREPGYETTEALADIFDVNLEYLLGRSDNPGRILNTMPAPTTTEDTVTFAVIGEVAAGYEHIMVEDWEGDKIEIPTSYLHGRPRSEYFCLRVIGDSMYPLYLDGDRVLVLKTDTLKRSGDIGLIRYNNDMATLKKVEFAVGEDWMRLVPLNPEYAPRTIKGSDLERCSVIGVPKLIIRTVNDAMA